MDSHLLDTFRADLFVLMLLTTIFLPGCVKEPALLHRGKPEVVIAAGDYRLQSDLIHLYADTVYILATNLRRSAGQTLIIDAGTLIKVNDRLSVTLDEGSIFDAQGNADNPIIFTSSAFTGGQGLQCSSCTSNHFWDGIIIRGNLLTAAPSQSSGILRYLRIEFAGGNDNDALPSLLLANVSRETTIENIQISYSSLTASYEFQGGNVNVNRLISYASNRSDFYIHGGYTGMMQNILAYRHPYFPNSISRTVAGLYIDGDGDSTTSPIISNLTVLGPDLQPGTAADYFQDPPQRRSALFTTGACRFHIRNSIFMGFPKVSFLIDNYSTAHALHFAESEFTNCIIHSDDTSKTFSLPLNTYVPFNSSDFKSYMLQSRFMNQLFINSEAFIFTDPFNYDIHPDPVPGPGSPLLHGARFDSVLFSDPFFQKVDYMGALGTDSWMKGWTNFTPLQTNYNN
jgi:hypothetical protein